VAGPFTAGKRSAVRLAAVAAVAALALAGCGSDDESGSDTTAADDASSSSGETLTVGYSAWPGWFPLAVAEEAGIFEEVGLDVELEFFADYTASLDALVAGQVDINSQTLSDTIFGVSAGSDQKIIVAGDNSTGNDAIICDESITSIEGLEGKTVAAEAGVVDHFLLLQGLATVGLTEEDVDFQGVKTDAAAAAFAGGQFDCVGVFAPFTVQALERPGSKVLFSSKDFPGVIPDHFVATGDVVEERPEDMQKFIEAWYKTLAYLEENPAEANEIMAEKAGISVEEYESLSSGTTLFDVDEALAAFEDRPDDPTSLPEMARRINPFLVESGLAEQEADLDGIFVPEFTETYAEGS
jgi:NitT/TauT family transport system substrate-binding protein